MNEKMPYNKTKVIVLSKTTARSKSATDLGKGSKKKKINGLVH